jgi:cytochrome o ubiquinol oxidase subunit 3
MKQQFPDTHHDVSSTTIFGFWVYLMTDAVMFATFFATYVVLQGGTFGGPGIRDIVHLPFVLTETLLLLASSFTCGIAMLGVPKRETTKVIFWFFVTFVLGLIFLGMEFFEFNRLTADGHNWQTSAFLSAYFTLIGTHGLHIVAGLFFLPFFLAQLWRCGFSAAILRRLTCFRIYWQFIYLIWIFTFTIVYLIGVK